MPSVEEIHRALRECYDPEIPINVLDLGLVYGIEQPTEEQIKVDLTLTSVACPMAESLVHQVRTRLERLPGINEVSINLVWTPPWDPSRASDDGRLQLHALGIPA